MRSPLSPSIFGLFSVLLDPDAEAPVGGGVEGTVLALLTGLALALLEPWTGLAGPLLPGSLLIAVVGKLLLVSKSQWKEQVKGLMKLELPTTSSWLLPHRVSWIGNHRSSHTEITSQKLIQQQQQQQQQSQWPQKKLVQFILVSARSTEVPIIRTGVLANEVLEKVWCLVILID